MYGKLRQEKAYRCHTGSLYLVFVQLGYRTKVESTTKRNGRYNTPRDLSIKWQDVKYIPSACYAGTGREKFYQYTMIDEASRESFIYAYNERSSYSTIDFTRRAIIYFG